MDAAAKKAVRRANAPQWKVAVGVGIGLALAAAPLAFKEVRAREQSVAQMRDAQYDKQGSKDDARDARLGIDSLAALLPEDRHGAARLHEGRARAAWRGVICTARRDL